MEAGEVIVAENLWHSYNGSWSLKGVSFSVRRGEIFGVLGPNGAGKTTLLSILTSKLRQAKGQATLLGLDAGGNAKRLSSRIGLASHGLRVTSYLSSKEVLTFYGRLYAVPRKTLENRVAELLRLIGLEERKNDLISTFSEGMRRRLNVALALVHDPDLVFLDEPTMGLDPHGRRQVWQAILGLSHRGKTVILTTHYMEEADFLCDRVAMLDSGVVVVVGTPAELKARLGEGKVVEIGVDSSPEIARELSAIIPGSQAYYSRGLKIVTKDPQVIVQYALKRFFADPDGQAARISVREPSLEDVFLELTGRLLSEHLDGIPLKSEVSDNPPSMSSRVAGLLRKAVAG